MLKEQRKKVSRLSFGDEGDGYGAWCWHWYRNPASAVKDAAVTAAHWKPHEEEDENAAVEGAHRADAGEKALQGNPHRRNWLKGRTVRRKRNWILVNADMNG